MSGRISVTHGQPLCIINKHGLFIIHEQPPGSNTHEPCPFSYPAPFARPSPFARPIDTPRPVCTSRSVSVLRSVRVLRSVGAPRSVLHTKPHHPHYSIPLICS